MERTIIRTKYLNVSLMPGVLFGVLYEDQELGIGIGPVALTIKLFNFNRRRKAAPNELQMDGARPHSYIQPIKLKRMTTFDLFIQKFQLGLAIVVYLGVMLLFIDSILPKKRKIIK